LPERVRKLLAHRLNVPEDQLRAPNDGQEVTRTSQLATNAPDDARALGGRIAEARKRLGINRSELSRRLDISPAAVAQWEGGTAQPASGNLRKLANILGVTFEWLGQGTGDRSVANAKSGGHITGFVAPALDDTMRSIWNNAGPHQRQLIVNNAIAIIASSRKS
jgi:transcriptional regulator with XRE-family HTH domain